MTLRELRQKKTAYNQKQMAGLLGISESAYCYYEKGLRRPNLDNLVKLAQVLGVDVQLLINIFLPMNTTKRLKKRA